MQRQNTKKRSGNNNNKPKTRPLMKTGKAVAAPIYRPVMHPLSTKYGKALLDPFATSTLGVKVPDAYSFPTTNYHLHGNVTMKADADGNFGVCFLPSPVLSMVDLNLDRGLSTSIVNSGMLAMGASPMCFQAADGGILSLTLATMRVASWGVKISNLLPELTATGKLFITLVPLGGGDVVPTETALKQIPISTNVIMPKLCGLTSQYLNSSAVEAQPTNITLTVGDLLQGDLQVAGTYTSPSFFNLKNTSGTSYYNATNNEANNPIVNNQGVVNTMSGNSELTNMLGGVGICIRGEGFPINSNSLMVEYIYHMEGSPTPSATQSTPVPSSSNNIVQGNQNILEVAMASVAGTRGIKWLARNSNFLNNVVETSSRVARSPLGRAAIGAVMGI